MSNAYNGEYILKRAAIDAVNNQCVDGKMWGNDESEGTLVDAYAVIDDISEIPAADVRPVPKGQWVELPRKTPNPITSKCGVYVGCSNCLAALPTDNFLDFMSESDSKFCYSCGADMTGG